MKRIRIYPSHFWVAEYFEITLCCLLQGLLWCDEGGAGYGPVCRLHHWRHGAPWRHRWHQRRHRRVSRRVISTFPLLHLYTAGPITRGDRSTLAFGINIHQQALANVLQFVFANLATLFCPEQSDSSYSQTAKFINNRASLRFGSFSTHISYR